MYVKLFGGPFDGREENVVDGTNMLRLQKPAPDGFVEVGAPIPPITERGYVTYIRSKADPKYFIYEGSSE